MRNQSARTVRLSDYQPPAWWVASVALRFELGRETTRVHSHLKLQRNPERDARELWLDGEKLELESLWLDGRELGADEYRLEEHGLAIPLEADNAEVTTVSRIHPQQNTELEGLYTSADFLLTQCEAEGFRRITWFPDRPDIMARYRVRLEADREQFPVLLSNGNPVAEGELDDGRHYVEWEDPHPKPSYLFALVAGDLGWIERYVTTSRGREVRLRIYAEHRNMDLCDYALESLVAALRWDEERFGLNCDLDVYNVVATDDFNMGAMENKGLNIFNSQFVLARADTATDEDFLGIESVIGHEYFHNWTGNRVTCRDWFQLSLKEGLTVFRDQEFSADRNSPAVKRIEDVRLLRAAQFPEDAGPMAHPVRPAEYQEISNFYTATVYIKGAEVVRMVHTLLGEEGFQLGMRRYIDHHDGQAVTIDDFLNAMADANQRELGQFRRWYDQAGTPVVHVSEDYDPEAGCLRLHLRQELPRTAADGPREPMLIPIRIGLLDTDGNSLPVRLAGEANHRGTSLVLELREREQTWTFEALPGRPVVSLLRGFSAPVRLEYPQDDAELAHLMAHDGDDFNRWEAGQRLGARVLLEMTDAIRAGREPAIPGEIEQAFAALLQDANADDGLRAEALDLPGESWLAEQVAEIDPVAIHRARGRLKQHLARSFEPDWQALYHDKAVAGPYRVVAGDIFRRRLRNRALDYLAAGGGAGARLVAEQLAGADNMTDRMAALGAMARHGLAGVDEALEEFLADWRDYPLVVNKWLALQAVRPDGDPLARIRELLRHDAFSLTNPNNVRALLGAFARRNPVGFHREDGAAYELLADRVLELDGLNPQMAAQLVGVFNPWKRMEAVRRDRMRTQLERIAEQGGLSRDVDEIVSRALA